MKFKRLKQKILLLLIQNQVRLMIRGESGSNNESDNEFDNEPKKPSRKFNNETDKEADNE